MNRIVLSFDVDGTLTLRGEPLKQEAWDILLHGRPMDVWEALLKAREKYSGGKGSRYDILREMLQEIGVSGGELEAKTEEWAKAYQDAVMSLIRSDFRPEARPVLEILKGRYKLYVNSATEEDGLKRCLVEVDLYQFFETIFGYPRDGTRKKADNLRLILEKEKIDPENLIHIGDSKSDLRATTEVGCRFIGVANDDNKWTPGKESFVVIQSLFGLENVVRSFFGRT